MSIKTVTYYQAVCDWPTCERTTRDLDTEHTAWSDEEAAAAQARDHHWLSSDRGDRLWCDQHPAVWSSDHNHPDGAAASTWPSPPFVLRHEGDGFDGASFVADHAALCRYLNDVQARAEGRL